MSWNRPNLIQHGPSPNSTEHDHTRLGMTCLNLGMGWLDLTQSRPTQLNLGSTWLGLDRARPNLVLIKLGSTWA